MDRTRRPAAVPDESIEQCRRNNGHPTELPADALTPRGNRPAATPKAVDRQARERTRPAIGAIEDSP